MFYALLKQYARFALKIYCPRVTISHPELLKSKGPLLFAANHPNSFLDGIILTTIFDGRVHSLARGDAFRNKWIDQFLRNIQLLPVYRTSEGVENLEHNYTTFAACLETFKEGESVLIFSEGRCENEWHLRPLKKGTARLALSAWENKLPLRVIPTAFNYSSFKKFGKEVHLYFGSPIDETIIAGAENSGKKLLQFNHELNRQLHSMVYEISPDDKLSLHKIFNVRKSTSFYFLLLPALPGFIIHAPLFYGCLLFTRSRFSNSGHYDSVLVSLLLIFYPLYILLLFVAALFFYPLAALSILFLMPFTAWAAVQVKYQAGW